MSAPVTFTIPGRIRGKGRPRTRVVGKYAHIYTDEKTALAEAEIRHLASLAMRGRSVFEGALRLNVTIWIHFTKTWSAKKRRENPIPTGKPDLDNIAKLVSDSMNAVVFRDDSQIAHLSIARFYISDDVPEQTEITVGPLLATQVAA